MSIPGLTVIGERINPGFRSTKQLFDNEDIEGIQALAIRQAEAGAKYLNVNCGTKALQEPDFMVRVVKAIQEVIRLPLSFDCPDFTIQKLCLEAYDQDRAGGEKPIVNSIAETRWKMAQLLEVRPCKILLMASERIEDGDVKPNTLGTQVYEVTRRMTDKLKQDYGLKNQDCIVDISVSAIAADFEGLTLMALDGTRLIRQDPDLAGIHISGGLSNIAQQMPPTAANGEPLGRQLENAFLTLAVPLGFDFVLGTPWHDYRFLPEDNPVMQVFREFLDADGMNAMKVAQKFYRKQRSSGRSRKRA